MDREHALLNPSGSHRWLHCTPSARYEERFPKTTSIYAEEGTLAHVYMALELDFFKGVISITDYQLQLANIKANKLYEAEMDTHVAATVNYIKGVYLHLKKTKAWVEMHVEIEVDYSHVAPEAFGHLDVSILSPGRIDILDLKYGKGVAVDAKGNPQLSLYAIGAIKVFAFTDTFKEAFLHIIQPRIDSITVDRVKTEDLTRWAEDVVKPLALLAFKGEGTKVPGDHCQFCAGKIRCIENAEYHRSLGKYDFEPPDELTNVQLAEIFLQSAQFINWINSIRDYATDQARNGATFPGLKLVAGRSNRKFISDSAVIEAMDKAGYSAEQYREFAALSIPKLEKLLGAKFKKILGKQVIKPQGAPTLVPLSDKRKSTKGAEGAKADFKDLKI